MKTSPLLWWVFLLVNSVLLAAGLSTGGGWIYLVNGVAIAFSSVQLLRHYGGK